MNTPIHEKHLGLLAIGLSLCLVALPFASRAQAQSHPSARALALGGSVVAEAAGLDAVAWNPAGVFRQAGHIQFDLVGISTQVHNNSFSVNDYNRYTGAVLSEADKDYIMERIPASGLELDAQAGARAFSFWASPVAVSITSDAVAQGTLSRDAVELLLYGNADFPEVDLAGTDGSSFVTASIGLSYAQPVATIAGGSLQAGGTVRYVKGIYAQEITEAQGHIETTAAGINGDAALVARTANNGTGVAADVGLLYDYGHGWRFGASVVNLIGSVNWRGQPEEYVVSFSVDSLTLLSADEETLIQSHDTTYAVAAFSTRLPSTLRLGASKVLASALWTMQWEQSLNSVTGTHTAPRLSGGAEFWLGRQIPLRAGLSLGGERGAGISAGSGIHTGLFYLDVGFGLGSGLYFGAAKGFELALNTGFRF
jgi:hypothetical protein